jgi:tetratricopeptide (TPR) repeat protein
VLFGLCALSRPNVLLFIAPALFWVYRKRGARPFLVVAVLIAACLVSAGWMNRYYGGERCLISTQGGINFYAGNGANADGLIPVEPENPLSPAETRARASRLPESVWSIDNLWTASLVIASAELGFPVRETEVSRWWFAKTFGQMARDPAAFLTRLVKKAAFLVGDVEVPNNLDPRFLMETFYPLLDFFDNWNRFSVLFALFVPGLCIAWNRYPETRVLSMYLSALALGLLAFFVNARFRVPLVPVLSLFAAVFLEALWKQFKRLAERPRRSAFLACAWLLAPAVLASQCFRFYPETWQVRASRGLFLNAVSNAYLNRGQTGEAIETVDKALELDTAEAFLFYRTRARIELEREGGLERAIRYLERSLELRRHPRTLRDLARLYGKAGRREDVAQMRETLSREYPETPL